MKWQGKEGSKPEQSPLTQLYSFYSWLPSLHRVKREIFSRWSKIRHVQGGPVEYGMCWYRPDEWEDLRRVADDRDDLEATWEEWFHEAIRRCQLLEQQYGFRVRRVHVEVAELVAWCRAHGRRVDAGARAEYAMFMLRPRA